MAVRPDYQRRGIGRLCLQHAVERVRDWRGRVLREVRLPRDGACDLSIHSADLLRAVCARRGAR
jgi:GNAT superfamily N-acetyltransferase